MKRLFIIFGMIVIAISIVLVESVMVSGKVITIYIDPGHGGSDGGAIGSEGTYEKDIVLSTSSILADLFMSNGINVIMIRTEDVDLAPANSKNRKRDDIHERVRLINNSNADLYLSIHANTFPDSYYWGAQTFFKKNESRSRELAVLIQDSLIVNLLNTYRLAKHINEIYLVDHVTIPGALIEIGFLSNKGDLELLKTKYYQQKVAMAIYLGVCDYLEKYQN
jgi:N-acetylmuramoyl-L-alanine amidase